MKHKVIFNTTLILASALSLAAWAQAPAPAASPLPLPAASATALLVNAKQEEIGQLQIFEGKHGALVRLNATHLTPGWHGFHFHQKGQCDDAGFKASGDHFSGHAAGHGVLTNGPHVGDLPNVYVNADGEAHVDAIAYGLVLKGDDGLLDKDGTAIILHAKADDYQSQPSGAAGDRIACGVVKAFDAVPNANTKP